MRESLFFKLGGLVYRFRIAIILLWILAFIACVPFLSTIITPFKTTGFTATNSQSDLANQYLDKHLGYNNNRFIVIYHSKDLLATDPAYIDKLKKSLSALKNFPVKHVIIYPDANKNQISKDKHTAYVALFFKGDTLMSDELVKTLKATIKTPSQMSMVLGGEAVFVEILNNQTQKDLYDAHEIAASVSIIILVLVFGSLIAAFVPIALGGGCAFIILTVLYFLGSVFNLSIFTLNIALLLGLCLILDYSLFIISRFRDEIRANHNMDEAVSRTLATAGKAVFFSGLAVFISLSALLLFPINILFSVGIGGMSAVFIAVAIAITLLPAVLAVLKHGINRLAIPYIFNEDTHVKQIDTTHVWHKLATAVVARPVVFFISALLVLLFLGYPFLNVRYGISDYHMLPEHSENRRFFDVYDEKFNANELTPIFMIVTSHEGKILSKHNLARLYHLSQRLKKNPLIHQVNSIVTGTKQLTIADYQALYRSSARDKNHDIKLLLDTTTRNHFTVITIVSNYGPDSPETKTLINQLKKINPGKGWSIQLTGAPVSNLDVLQSIAQIFPYAVLWIMLLTYLILLILLRSIFLPFKAILMNMLSLCASYGVLVFIFQEGHLHHLLNFNPQGMLDISMLIIIFCALFGFSMDYEVFLLTRIHEYHIASKDNEKSVIFGIVKSSRIITSAAIIVISICGAFMVADNLMVKEFGLGIAVAIFVDAFIIRTLLVPATMVLVKEYNWYLPKWLDRLLPNKDSSQSNPNTQKR